MKFLKFFTVVLLAVSLGSCARRVVVAEQPAAPVEVRPVSPGPNYVWVQGEWVVVNGRYVWKNGYWAPARVGHVWVAGHWVARGNGWYWVPGHWN